MKTMSPQLEGQRANVITVGFSVPAQKQSSTTAGSGVTTGNGNAGKTLTDVPAQSSGAADLLSSVNLQEKLAYGTMTFKRQRAGDDFHFQISFAPSNRVGCNDIAFVQAVTSTALPRKLKKHAAHGGATIDQSDAQLSPFYTVDSSLFWKREDKGPGLPHKPTTGIPGKGGKAGWPAVMQDAPLLPSTAAVFESCAICRGDGSSASVGSVYGCVLWTFVGNEEGFLDPARIPMTYFAERESRDFVAAGNAWNKWRRKHGRFGTREELPELHAPPSPVLWAGQNKAGPLLQRKCSCDGACDDCSKKKLQRAAPASLSGGHVPPIVHEVLRSSGQSLDSATRRSMEAHFAHDFSSVRTHSGSAAAASARAVGAEAYTAGRHIVFGAQPVTPHILAHELAHVVQNGGGDVLPERVGAADSEEEIAADRAAAGARGSSVPEGAAVGLYRDRSKKALDLIHNVENQPRIDDGGVHCTGVGVDNIEATSQTVPMETATAAYAPDKAALASLPISSSASPTRKTFYRSKINKNFTKVPVSRAVYRRATVDGELKLDKSMCGCQDSLKMDVLIDEKLIEAYKACGEKYPHEWGDVIHKCARRKLRKQGYRTHIVGTSTVGGNIEIWSDPDDKCAAINDYIALQHELRHKAHENAVRKEGHTEDEVFDILSIGSAVAAQEVEDYQVEVTQLNEVIGKLSSLCTAEAPK